MIEYLTGREPDWVHAALAIMCIVQTGLIIFQEHLLRKYDGAILFWPDDDVTFSEDFFNRLEEDDE